MGRLIAALLVSLLGLNTDESLVGSKHPTSLPLMVSTSSLLIVDDGLPGVEL